MLTVGDWLTDTKGVTVVIDEILKDRWGYSLLVSTVDTRTRRARFKVYKKETLIDHGYKIDTVKQLLYKRD